MLRKLMGLIAFIITGVGLVFTSQPSEMSILNIGLLLLVGFFYTVSIIGHFKDLKE
jgi:hypothetical protein